MKRKKAIIRILLALLMLTAAGGTGVFAEEPECFLLPEIVLDPADGGGEVISAEFPAGVEENGLAEEYIRYMLPQRRSMLRVARPSGLTQFPEDSPNRNLYTALRERVTAVAGGEQSDTVFRIGAQEIFSQTAFTAEDLGVEALFADEKITEAARTAILDRYNEMVQQIDIRAVVASVVADSPYEMYWFAKKYRADGNFNISSSADASRLLIRGTYDVTLYVSPDYAEIPEDWDGKSGLHTFDTDKYGGCVTRAKNRIREILDASSGMDDYGRIRYYAEAICDAVSYNTTAEREFKNGERAYGDPWQLIWVFDPEGEHQVVCEGYSKAFAYLCELGTQEAVAITAQGSIPAGAHMWNIVTIDGHNYLADLTNWDNGMDLFLVGAVSGNVTDGYDTAAIRGYRYDREITARTDAELSLSFFSYADWLETTATAPVVRVSSTKTYPGYAVAVQAESACEAISAEKTLITVSEGEETREITQEGNTAILFLDGNAVIEVAAVIDGITTPAAGAIQITVAETPANSFALPANAEIETEAFSGIDAKLIQVYGNEVAAGAFDPDAILAVDETGSWFEKDVRFVIREEQGTE